MGATDDSTLLTLGAADAADALVLSREAHWNQTEADWLLFLTSGHVFGIRYDGRLVATAALLPYGDGNAWISMVLVTADWQRRGLATRLMQACLNAAAEQRLTTWLDATPAGATVYEPMGFAPVGKLQRLALRQAGDAPPTAKPLRTGTLDELIDRDRRAIGFDRGTLLDAIIDRPNSSIIAQGDALALIRDGRTARHIGPLFADDADAAATLVSTIAASDSRPILLDASDDDRGLINRLTSTGWVAERPFLRMRLGTEAAPSTQAAFAGAGPEYG